MSDCVAEIETEIVGGYEINSQTGEILRYVGEPGFHIHDLATCEWVLERFTDREAQIAGYQAKLKAVTDNLNAMIRREQAKLDRLHERFDAELDAYARQQLEGRKERTLHTTYGSLSLRKSPERWTWAKGKESMAKAVEYVKAKLGPDRVRVVTEETVTLETVLEAAPDPSADSDTYAFLEFVPAAEKLTIKTGVTK